MLSSNGRASNRLVVGRGTDAGSGGRMPHSRSWRGVSMRVRLFAGLGLVVALLATFAALQALPLQAQSLTTLVSNTHIESAVPSSAVQAQSFGTGTNADGYTVSEVQISLADGAGTKTTRVRIREDDGGEPGHLVANLTNPAALTANSFNTFTAPPGTTLSARTTYWLTMNEGISATSRFSINYVGADGETGKPGWSIGNGRLFRTNEASSWITSGNSNVFEIRGTLVREPGEVLVTKKLLSLTEGNQGDYLVLLNSQPAADVTVTIGGHAGTNVTPNPTSLTFTTSDWRLPQSVTVPTTADTNRTNESVRLTHTATSSDSFFNNITGPSVIVNVDDQDAPDHHIRTITPPQGSHALPPGDKVLPEEEITVRIVVRGVEHDILVVAEGHRWRPSGIWGDPDADTVWVGVAPATLASTRSSCRR